MKTFLIALAFVSSCGPLHMDQASADTVFTSTKPNAGLKIADVAAALKGGKTVYQCRQVKMGKNINPVVVPGTDNIYQAAAPSAVVDDPFTALAANTPTWRCSEMTFNASSGRLAKVK